MSQMNRRSIKRGLAVSSGLLLALIALVASAASPQTAIMGITVGSVNDASFKVWWVTDTVTDGRIRWGATPALGHIAEDVRGSSTQTDVHFVTVSGLSPTTTYYFDVESGGAVVNNGGAHSTLTTGPILGIPGPEAAYGRIMLSNGTAGKVGAALLVSLQDADGQGSPGTSAPMAALSEGDGWWFVDLGGARTVNLNGSFEHSLSGDRLVLFAEGGADGQDYLNAGPGISVPLPNLVLQACPWDLDSDNQVAASDLTVAARAWDKTSGQAGYNALADFDSSGRVGTNDIMVIAAHWNQTCP
ncbi:hypothetical protein [Candidatus Amarolinea aalborgensis]|uniref:hypothetical protein n=1 Tax=Candidatus Amarolinea aalborgensis TaxID=2249329 RepID=UPI003BF99FC0